MLDPIALSLYAKYKKGLLPPRMGVQLEDPRRLIMYDTFNRVTTTAEGLGVSDSGHQWTTLEGSFRIPANTKLATPASSSGGIASVDIGGLQDGFTVHALLRSTRGGSRTHGVLIAWVDSQNYIVGRLTFCLVIRRIVGGVSTDGQSLRLTPMI